MRVFQTFNQGEAHYIAYITQDVSQADLCVYITKNQGLAYGENRWFITNNKTQTDKTLFFGSRGSAQLVVCFVNSPALAGWQRNHPLQGKLCRF
ncbi:DUF6150 family protein [Alteromonas sp. a30]|uniref:DUF6150 family protein n=1 Tax=Alteromonas sp. a30 TaxID=2730917 RepID=UPI002280DD86|nr:DUF6150 family protein [Alteromonas sp. a30]MCY7293854.1 hypothetical protein [Alteromonas sp. a30]